jgi:hypothetical protein
MKRKLSLYNGWIIVFALAGASLLSGCGNSAVPEAPSRVAVQSEPPDLEITVTSDDNAVTKTVPDGSSLKKTEKPRRRHKHHKKSPTPSEPSLAVPPSEKEPNVGDPPDTDGGDQPSSPPVTPPTDPPTTGGGDGGTNGPPNPPPSN